MKNLLYLRKVFLLLLLSMFIVPHLAQAQQKALGRLWEYIYDPSNPAFTAQKNEVVNFLKNNFDANNIPLISIAKLAPEGGKLYGIDSVYKHSDAYAMMRWKTWYKYFRERAGTNAAGESKKLEYPWFNYRGLPLLDETDDLLTFLTPSGARINANWLGEIKHAWDTLDSKNGGVKAWMPITSLTSEIKDGRITGSLVFTATDRITPITASSFIVNIILAEGYHKYGNEEHYFIPRWAALGVGGLPQNSTADYVGKAGSVPFEFHIDKSWNTKYLYVIGIIEHYPFYPQAPFVFRTMLDAAVDKPVDVRTAEQHTPLKLNITHNTDAQKSSKVATNSSTDIVFKVENPSNKAVKALAYIDSTTSSFGDLKNWIVTKSADTISIPANTTTTLTVKVQAPANESATAFDLAILPIETDINVNPIISNALTVVATNNINILGLADKNMTEDKMLILQFPLMRNSYYSQYATVPLQYHSVINVDQFAGYIVVAGSSYRYARYPYLGDLNIKDGPAPVSYHTIYSSLNANLNTDIQHELATNNILDEAQVKFLNAIIDKGKHLALFMDRTAVYSTLASTPATAKTELGKLFTSFGVSFKDETYRLVANDSLGIHMPRYFNVTGAVSDPLTQYVDDIVLNDNPIISVAYTTTWNITSPTTSRVFSYADISNSNAAVKTTKGNSKLFLAGFGLEGASDATLMKPDAFETFFENLLLWWFGAKPEAKPVIAVDKTSLDFGTQTVGGAGNTLLVVVSNNATDENDVLTISSSSAFRNNTDNSFSVIDLPIQIAPGQKDTIVFSFNPISVRQYTGVAYILRSNATNNAELSIACTGEGIASSNTNPVLSISDNMLSQVITDATVGETYNKSIMFTNSGEAPLVLNTIKFSNNTDATLYSFKSGHNTPKTINKNENHTIGIQFLASKIGKFDAEVEIHSNDPAKPIVKAIISATVVDDIQDKIAEMFNCAVSPIPANDLLNIEFNVIGNMSRNVKLNIIDQTGKTLSTVANGLYIPNNYKQSIDVKFLASGSYFLEYVIDDMRAVTPFSIAR